MAICDWLAGEIRHFLQPTCRSWRSRLQRAALKACAAKSSVTVHSSRLKALAVVIPMAGQLDDALWYYGPEVSALAVNRNQIDVFLTGGSRQGDPATLRIEPPLGLHSFSVLSKATTGGKQLGGSSTEESLRFDRATNNDAISRVLTISGQVAPGQTVSEGFAVADPPGWAAVIFQRALQEQGVAVENGDIPSPAMNSRNLAVQESPPVRVLLRRFLKNSDNLYGEMLLRAAARYSDNRTGAGTAARGNQLLFAWLKQNGIDTSALRMTDGSGLSRYNLITPRATVQLLAAVQRLPNGDALWDALPAAGVDGTLSRRMKGHTGAKQRPCQDRHLQYCEYSVGLCHNTRRSSPGGFAAD
jgi:D-alanyl-D-alanine carboxypeptidase/D-alanyl-D-alanine-endopeptidase (penicillin-binding protein 4)